jgi:hypothetical protein
VDRLGGLLGGATTGATMEGRTHFLSAGSSSSSRNTVPFVSALRLQTATNKQRQHGRTHTRRCTNTDTDLQTHRDTDKKTESSRERDTPTLRHTHTHTHTKHIKHARTNTQKHTRIQTHATHATHTHTHTHTQATRKHAGRVRHGGAPLYFHVDERALGRGAVVERVRLRGEHGEQPRNGNEKHAEPADGVAQHHVEGKVINQTADRKHAWHTTHASKRDSSTFQTRWMS